MAGMHLITRRCFALDFFLSAVLTTGGIALELKSDLVRVPTFLARILFVSWFVDIFEAWTAERFGSAEHKLDLGIVVSRTVRFDAWTFVDLVF